MKMTVTVSSKTIETVEEPCVDMEWFAWVKKMDGEISENMVIKMPLLLFDAINFFFVSVVGKRVEDCIDVEGYDCVVTILGEYIDTMTATIGSGCVPEQIMDERYFTVMLFTEVCQGTAVYLGQSAESVYSNPKYGFNLLKTALTRGLHGEKIRTACLMEKVRVMELRTALAESRSGFK